MLHDIKRCFGGPFYQDRTGADRPTVLEIAKGPTLTMVVVQIPQVDLMAEAEMPGGVFSPMPVSPVILLVEDDLEISQMLADVLTESGFTPVMAPSPPAMDAYLTKGAADLVILDVMLPGENGFDICKRLRASSAIPIIVLTALGEEVDRVVGLEIGADDYVTKPFSSRELIARIRALLRRTQSGQPRKAQLNRFQFADWRLERSSRQLFNPEGVRIGLTSAEFDLLLAFCQNPGRVLSRDQLLELTHSGLAGPISRSVDVHVSRIRQKIEPNSEDATYIKTVRLGGYIFTPIVEAS